MKKRDPVEERRSRLSGARDAPGSPESLEILRRGLADGVHVVVARAAEIVSELEIAALTPELCRAFDRFLAEPSKDKGCLAKIAILEALVRLQIRDPDVFLKAIRHVQREPVWGGSEDTAAWLRGLAGLGLVECAHPDVATRLVELLADPEKLARVGGARALSALGRPESALLLRLKLLLGDPELEVTSECFQGLLSLEPQAEASAFVGRFLGVRDPAVAEAAALALGESRRPEAFGVLRECWDRSLDRSFRRVLAVALALTRLDAATELLVDAVASGTGGAADAALSALGPFLYGEELRRRVGEAVRLRGDASLQEAFRYLLEVP